MNKRLKILIEENSNGSPRRKAKLSEIRYFYRFKPEFKIWFDHWKRSRYMSYPLVDETWYDGYAFTYGRFLFLSTNRFSINIRFTWWKLKFTK